LKAAREAVPLSGAAVAALAVTAGVAIANDYAMQPALADIAADLHVPASQVTLVASGTLLGYIAGLAVLVPLVDRISPRTLICWQMAVLATTLALAAAASAPAALIGCFVLVGAASTVAAQCSAVVGRHCGPGRRAHAMGAVSAGISVGILSSRFVGGLFAQWWGWRGALHACASFAVVVAIVVWSLLPKQHTRTTARCFETLRQIPRLWLEFARLRRSALAGMLWFFAFNLVWVGLAIRLAAAPYHLSARSIGLYSLAGLLGLAVTRVAGRLADRFGARAVLLAGLATASLASAALAVSLGHPAWTAAALAFFDAGCFAAQVANQASIVALDPARSGALSAAYLTPYYIAGALGAAAAGSMVSVLGWGPAAATSAIAVAAAAVIGGANQPSPRPAE
jgi:predicted MFS family arabinose efflux permease